jgi:hypothetical protein
MQILRERSHQHDGPKRNESPRTHIAEIDRARLQARCSTPGSEAESHQTGSRLMPIEGDAIRYVGIYTLDLFCDQLHDPRIKTTFTGQTFSGCCAKAKRAGWRIHRHTKTATCPTCTKHLRKMALRARW